MIRDFLKALALTIREEWVVQVLILLGLTTALYYGWKFLYNRFYPRIQKSKTLWDGVILNAMYKPIAVFIWLVGLTLSGQILAKLSPDNTALLIDVAIRKFGIILLFTWFWLRLINLAQKTLVESHPKRDQFDKTTIIMVTKVLYLVVLLVALMIGLQTFGIGISGLLAFGSLSGAAVAFASKDLLANFFGGLIIYLDKPFAVGDWIRSPDKEIEGYVEHIGWRLTRIRTLNKRPLYVPNAIFTTIAVENPSRMTNRQILTTVGIRYEDAGKMPEILHDIKTMIHHHDEIDLNQGIKVNFVEFGNSSLNINVNIFTKTTNSEKYLGIQQDIFLKILDIITRHGAQCPFPTTTLSIPEGLNVRTTNHDAT